MILFKVGKLYCFIYTLCWSLTSGSAAQSQLHYGGVKTLFKKAVITLILKTG